MIGRKEVGREMRDTRGPYKSSNRPMLAFGAFGLLLMALAGLKEQVMGLLAAGAGIFGGNTVIGDLLILFAIIAFIIAIVMLVAMKGAARSGIAGAFAVGIALLLIGVLWNAANPLSTTTVTSAPTGAALTGYIASGTLPTGCSINTITNVEFCTADFNTNASGSGGGFYIASANTTILGNKPNWIDFQIHVARTDALNATYGFLFTVTSIQTINTITSSPVAYSPLVGYTPATSTSSGVWKLQFDKGSNSLVNPSVAAPGTTTSVLSSQVGVAAFSGTTVGLHVSLPGGNSTYLPPFVNGAQGTGFVTYTLVVTVANCTPGTFTLQLEPIAFPA